LRTLVTGGSGFIGTNLVQQLLDDGSEVLSLDTHEPRSPGQARCFRQCNVLDLERLRSAVEDFKPSVVIHLAARCDLAGKSLDDYRANTDGVANIIDCVNKSGRIERVLFASTRYVHRGEQQPKSDDDYSPFSWYGVSKANGEQIVRQADLAASWTIFRPTSIWGPWFRIPYRAFFDAIRRGVYFHPRNERVYKSFGYVGNAVHQILTMARSSANLVHKRTFYIADYTPIEVRGMAEVIRERFDAPPIREIPVPLLKTLALGGDILRSCGWYSPPLTSERLKNLRMQMVYDLSTTKEIVEPLPYTLERGVEHTAQWIESHA
jgi:nucleoside-diphosphate-sugar epimerase